MTRKELEAAIDSLVPLMNKIDELDYGTQERADASEAALSVLKGVGKHLALCLHDIREALVK